MEHSSDVVDGDLSSMTNHSFATASSGGWCSGAASDESGWTTYIDYFMETKQQQQLEEEEAAAASTAASATDDIIGLGCHEADHQSPLPELVEPSSEVSRRLSFRKKEGGGRRKKKLLLYDESLEDTATSRISTPKLFDSMNSYDRRKSKEKTTDEFDHCNNHYIITGSTDMINDDSHDHNVQPKKKGLNLLSPSVYI